MFSCILFQFLHKIIQKGILVISYEGTHFSPYNLSLSIFNLSIQIICQILFKKSFLVCIRVSLGRFSPYGHFGLFTSNKFWTKRYFKIPHFGNLSVLVHFVSFNCFTLRFLKLPFFTNFIFTFCK